MKIGYSMSLQAFLFDLIDNCCQLANDVNMVIIDSYLKLLEVSIP